MTGATAPLVATTESAGLGLGLLCCPACLALGALAPQAFTLQDLAPTHAPNHGGSSSGAGT